jgi:hypothetical protein
MLISWPLNKNIGDIYTSPNGSKWRWSGKAWVSLRENPILALGPAGTYEFSHCPMDPVDDMRYYIGNIPDLPAQSNGSIKSRRIKSLIGGSIKHISIMTQILGEVGSNDPQIFIINNYTSGQSSIVTSNYINYSNSQLDNYELQNKLDVSINDELEIIWEVPVFSSSPTSVRHNFIISIE